MYYLAVLGMSGAILSETIQQLAFKYAHKFPTPSAKYYGWTAVGAFMYVPHLLAWFFTLTLLPLSIGAPLLGVCYMTVPLASKFLFHEKISKRRWLGIALIVIGMALMGKEMMG